MLPIQTVHFVKGIDPVADALSGTVYTDIVNCAGYGEVTFVLYNGVGATGTQTLTVEACDDTSGTTTAAIPFWYRQVTTGDTEGTLAAATTTGFTTTAGSSKVVIISVKSNALAASGYQYMRLKSVEVVDSPCLAGVLILMSEPRDSYEPHATAIV